jgi:hypothetical protein
MSTIKLRAGAPDRTECWKDGKTYDEQVYVAALQKRNPLLAGLFTATGIGWQSSAGFQYLSANPS